MDDIRWSGKKGILCIIFKFPYFSRFFDIFNFLSHLLSKIITRTNEEEVADNVSNHFLVQVTIVDMLPVGVLEQMKENT